MLISVVEGDPPRPENQEVLIEQDNENETLDVFIYAKRVRNITLYAMNIGAEYADHLNINNISHPISIEAYIKKI